MQCHSEDISIPLASSQLCTIKHQNKFTSLLLQFHFSIRKTQNIVGQHLTKHNHEFAMSLSRFFSLAFLLSTTALVVSSPLPANSTLVDVVPRALGYNCGPQYYSLPEADDAWGDGVRRLRNGQFAYTTGDGMSSYPQKTYQLESRS